ncbi:MAG TPA: anti-virulence regulator CigR family protein [Dongiaceae bacterium]|nr:anti-virulence regulator CigR family protein [Dongiaceae bacterium]
MIRAKLAPGLILAAIAAGPVAAGGNGKGHGHAGQDSPPQAGQAMGGQVTFSAVITPAERQTILGYFQQHPAGYAGAKPLPPGIAKKLARGGTLPPGIAKRYFPTALIAELPARPGQQWLIVGSDVLLVQVTTNVILDLIPKLF